MSSCSNPDQARLFYCSYIHAHIHAHIQRGGGGARSLEPLKNQANIGPQAESIVLPACL